MSIAVVTTFSPRGYEVYGRRMIESFARFWPVDVKLYVYYEGIDPPEDIHERAIWLSLDADEDRKAFIATHDDHPVNYRWMPVKFSHKVFAVTAAPRNTDWLIWLDGDVETTAPVTHEFLNELLPQDVDVVYLGREWWQHSECGFVAYNIRPFATGIDFLNDMRRMYVSGEVLQLPELHDCAVFDHIRTTMNHFPDLFLDLGAAHKGPGLDVMPHTPLGAVMTHYKGPKAKRAAYGSVA